MRWTRAADKKRSTSPSAVVGMSIFGSCRDGLAGRRLDEALNLGPVVLGSHARGRARPIRAGRSSSRAPGERDTWTFVFMADSRSRVLPGASPSLRKVTIPHCSTPRSFTLTPGRVASSCRSSAPSALTRAASSPDDLRTLRCKRLSFYRVSAILSNKCAFITILSHARRCVMSTQSLPAASLRTADCLPAGEMLLRGITP
jgi:hypothetical protein